MRLWTFRFIGGDPFVLRIPWNPAIDHDGGTTIAHVLCTETVASTITGFAEQHDTRVLRHTEGQTEEQAAERKAMLGNPDSVFLCGACPTCFWFDPKLDQDHFCGVEGWPDDFKMAACQIHSKAMQDLWGCPMRQP